MTSGAKALRPTARLASLPHSGLGPWPFGAAHNLNMTRRSMFRQTWPPDWIGSNSLEDLSCAGATDQPAMDCALGVAAIFDRQLLVSLARVRVRRGGHRKWRGHTRRVGTFHQTVFTANGAQHGKRARDLWPLAWRSSPINMDVRGCCCCCSDNKRRHLFCFGRRHSVRDLLVQRATYCCANKCCCVAATCRHELNFTFRSSTMRSLPPSASQSRLAPVVKCTACVRNYICAGGRPQSGAHPVSGARAGRRQLAPSGERGALMNGPSIGPTAAGSARSDN